MRSLRAQTLAAAFLLVAVVIASTLLLSRQVVVSEFDAFVQRGESRAAAGVRSEIQAFVDRTGSLDGIDALLADIHRRTDATIILVRGADTIAAAPSRPDTINIAGHDDGLIVSIRDGGTQAELAFRGSLPEITGANGQVLASAIIVPFGEGARGEFNVEVNRGLWWIAAGIGLGGVLLSGWAAGRLVRPVEQLTAAARKLAGGDLGQRVTVLRTDEVGQLGNAFNTMAEGLERNERLRRSLLNDVAHELRTPLTHVRAELEALQDGLRQPTPEVIDRLHADARHLEQLVDDLRDLAQAEAGQLRLAIEDVDLGDAMRAAAASLESTAAAKRVRIEASLAFPALVVHADRARLRQILVNLLDNAVRYAPTDSVVSITAAGVPQMARVSITDQGPGVADDDLPRLFDRFFRADESRDRRTGGAGLGLAIVKHLAALQGGSVEAVNLSPHGFRVTVALPCPHK